MEKMERVYSLNFHYLCAWLIILYDIRVLLQEIMDRKLNARDKTTKQIMNGNKLKLVKHCSR